MLIGALGTSLTWGADLPNRDRMAWPTLLQSLLTERTRRTDLFVLNGGMRASSADFAALCFDELWGAAWTDSRGVARGPRLDLAIIEYNWSSSPSQLAALIEAMHARGIACVGVLYYHPVNVARLGRHGVKNDPTPWQGVEKVGRQKIFARIFEEHNVPFINTSVLNFRYGYRAMLNTTKNIWSAAHLSPLGHEGIAALLAETLLVNCTAAFYLPPRVLSTSKDYFCRIGSSLAGMRAAAPLSELSAQADVPTPVDAAVSNESMIDRNAWQLLIPPDGRTPGLVTVSPNATLWLHVPPPSGHGCYHGRFLSLGFECSHQHDGVVTVGCAGSCTCSPFGFSTQSRKKYTYLQRTKPVWLAPTGSPEGVACELTIRTTHFTRGRVMLKAVMVSSPRSGNRSVSTSSLYALDYGPAPKAASSKRTAEGRSNHPVLAKRNGALSYVDK